jgi:hypothetical protein
VQSLHRIKTKGFCAALPSTSNNMKKFHALPLIVPLAVDFRRLEKTSIFMQRDA